MAIAPDRARHEPPPLTPTRKQRWWRRSPYLRNPYARRRRGPTLTEAFLFVAIFVVLIVVDGIYVSRSIPPHLSRAGELLQAGADAVQGGETSQARDYFSQAIDEAGEARTLAARPSVWIAGFLPVIQNDVNAVRALARSAELFGKAGVDATQTVEVLGDTTGAAVAESIYADGRLQFETIERARIGIAAALESLQKASALLESAPPPNIGRLSNALDAARAQVDQLVPRATAAENLLDAIPQMLGRDEPRRYLVALQGLGEARATGGLIGLYGVMEAVEGKLYLVSAGRTVELTMNPRHPLDDGILAPSWFAKRYGNLDFSSVNASPSFPFVARSLLNLFKAVTGRQLDGVWSFDAVAFQELTKATGPLRGPGFNVPLGPENATRVLVEDAYDHFATDPEALTRYLLGLINDLYRSIDERNADPRTLLQSVADSAAGGHFNIYSRVSEEQDTLHSLGLDGALDTESVAQLVYHNNLEGNKVDFLLERQITTAIKLMPDRSAQVVTEVSLVNRAESGPPSILLGIPTQGQRPGVNNMELDFVLTRDIADVDLTIDGERFVPTLGLEGSLPVASLRVELAPGEQKKVALSYTLKGVQRFIESGRDFSFTLVPQPRPYPDTYRVKVTAPTGFGLLRDDASVTARPSGDLTFKGILDRSTQIDVRIVPR